MILFWQITEGWLRLSCNFGVWLHWSQFIFVDWISSNLINLVVSSLIFSWFHFDRFQTKVNGSLDLQFATLFLPASA